MIKKLNEGLTKEQEEVLFHHGTEAPFTGKYYLKEKEGIYHCANCDIPLFKTEEQFDSGCGWPSFTNPIEKSAVIYKEDMSHGMNRTEVICGNCGVHLGHVFPDGPGPGGQRFCINSLSLELEDEEK